MLGGAWGRIGTRRELEETRRWHRGKVVVIPGIVEGSKLISVVTEVAKDSTTYQWMRAATMEGTGMRVSLMKAVNSRCMVLWSLEDGSDSLDFIFVTRKL